jgi:hypothetical protein
VASACTADRHENHRRLTNIDAAITQSAAIIAKADNAISAASSRLHTPLPPVPHQSISTVPPQTPVQSFAQSLANDVPSLVNGHIPDTVALTNSASWKISICPQTLKVGANDRSAQELQNDLGSYRTIDVHTNFLTGVWPFQYSTILHYERLLSNLSTILILVKQKKNFR